MLWALVASACLLAAGVQAQNFPEIKAKELKEMMDAGESLLLINPLSDVEYNAQHIPGSVNIPLQKILIAELPKDKNQLIVTYCLGRK
jgi:rhodanese-related sulfurtransferase